MAEAPTRHAKILYAMLRHTQDEAKLHERLSEHLAWIGANAKAGLVFASGPTEPTVGSGLNGLTIIEAISREAADALAQQDPLIRSGAVTYLLHTWTVNEGLLALT